MKLGPYITECRAKFQFNPLNCPKLTCIEMYIGMYRVWQKYRGIIWEWIYYIQIIFFFKKKVPKTYVRKPSYFHLLVYFYSMHIFNFINNSDIGFKLFRRTTHNFMYFQNGGRLKFVYKSGKQLVGFRKRTKNKNKRQYLLPF